MPLRKSRKSRLIVVSVGLAVLSGLSSTASFLLWNEKTQLEKQVSEYSKLTAIVSRIQTVYGGIGQGLLDMIGSIEQGKSLPESANDYLVNDKSELLIKNLIESHGLLKYGFRFDWLRSPVESASSYIAVKDGEYGPRYRNRKLEFHHGIDLVNPYNEVIFSASDGKVVKQGYDLYIGNYIIIEYIHEGYTFRLLYGHLYSATVLLDESVKRGQAIGIMGETGKDCTGKHLHFGVFVARKYGFSSVNPFVNTSWKKRVVPYEDKT